MTKSAYPHKNGRGLKHLEDRIDKGLWPALRELQTKMAELERRLREVLNAEPAKKDTNGH